MKPGTVVTANFQGVVSTKRRPAVVVSSETYQQERPDAILAVVTTQIGKANSKTDYILQDWQTANLNKPSAVRIFLFTLPQSEINKIGKLSDRDWTEVKSRLQIAFNI
ncbi:type II toxin-antitoxin system PemK/MazF family toxin [soil metagenome]